MRTLTAYLHGRRPEVVSRSGAGISWRCAGGGARNFLAAHEVNISRLKDVAFDQVRRLILVDVEEPDRLGPLKVLSSRADVEVHIYDHHGVIESGEGSRSPQWPLVTQRDVQSGRRHNDLAHREIERAERRRHGF